jgi:hypothetical protein
MTKVTTVRLPDELARQAADKAAADGISLAALIEEALRQLLDEPRHTDEPHRSLPPVSKATGGLLPGIDLDSSAQLQELDDLEYLSRPR